MGSVTPDTVLEQHEAYGFLTQPHLHAKATYRAAQITYPGNLKAALAHAVADPTKTLFGVAHGIPSVFVTKLLASTGPDFIWIDAEHGMFSRLELHDAIHAALTHSEGKALVIVRVPKHDEVSLSTALDAGASGIVMPHTESAEEVRAMLKEVYFPPLGQRSFSPWTFTPGVSDRSLYPGDPFNMRTSNNHILLIPQIESVRGVENVEEIAAVEGVGALMFGPGDFMADAGLPLAFGGEPHPVFAAAMARFAAAGQKYARPLFGAAQVPEMIPGMIAGGYRAIAVSFDYWGLVGMVAKELGNARAIVAGQAKKEAGAAENGHAPASTEVVERTKPEE